MSTSPRPGRRSPASPDPRAPPSRRPRAWRPTCARGGVIVPLLTALLAFLVGGLVILVTGHNPLSTYKAIFNGTGLNWFFPWIVGRRAHDRGAEPAADADHHHAADPDRARGGLRLPLRPVQHRRPGPVPRRLLSSAVWVGSSFAGMPRLPHIVLAIVAATLAGAVWAGIAGLLKATVGAHEVISTIMLNWIALLGRQLPVRAPRAAAEQRPVAAVGAGLQRRRGERQAARSSGATPSCRACTSGSSSRSPPWSSSGSCSTARRRATRCARSASTPRRRATAASAWRATTSS